MNGEGPVDSSIMLVGEAPGAKEDVEGRPFVGRSGKLLDSVLKSSGVERSEIFITNVVRCRPPNNRKPTEKEIKTCLPFLVKEIKKVHPKIVVALGAVAIKSLIGSDGKVGVLVGKELKVEFEGINIRVVPCYHPAAAMRNRKIRAKFEKIIRSVTARYF